MAIANQYNPRPRTTDSILRDRQLQYDAMKSEGSIQPQQPQVPQQNPRVLGVDITPDYQDKSFLRKVGEDAALLAYSIPVGLAKVATGLVTQPIETAKELGSGMVQSAKDVVDPEYYKAHPLLGLVNLAGFVQPVAGIARSTALKAATESVMSTALREATTLGVSKDVMATVLNKKVILETVTQAAKTGKTEMASEVVRNLLTKGGVAEDVALRVGNAVSDNLFSNLSRQSTKLKTLEAIANPVGSSYKYLSDATESLRTTIFGEPNKTAVAALYGLDAVKKNPEGFLDIERWAEMQVAERGLENTMMNRQRVMQDWVEQNSQWASLSPEERIAHFKNYAKQDLIRLDLHKATGIDIVTTKSLPQNYVDAMIETVQEAPKLGDEAADLVGILKTLEDNFDNDFAIHAAEIKQALSKGNTRENLIRILATLGDSRSVVSFAKFSPEIQALAAQIEKSGYRIGRAPTTKDVSFVSDIFAKSAKESNSLFSEARKHESGEEFVKNNDLIFQGGKEGTTSGFWSTKIGYANAYGTQKGMTNGEIRVARFSDLPEEIRMGLTKDEYFKERGVVIGLEKELNPQIIATIPADKTGLLGDSVLNDIWNQAWKEKGSSQIAASDVVTKQTTFGRWLDGFGLSPRGLVEGAAEYSFRENFTQRALVEIGDKFGRRVKVGKVSVPVEKLFQWLDKKKETFSQFREGGIGKFLPVRTVFDIKTDDLIRAGFKAEVAEAITAVSKSALRDVPPSLVGMSDKVINYLRTSNRGFGAWMSDVYDTYLQTAYKGRYDWSPFFGAQQWLETHINSAILLKDARTLPGARGLLKLGDWTADKLGKKLLETKTYLREVLAPPTLEETALVKNEVLGNLQKTMLDVTTPDMMQIQNAALGNLKDKAAFQQSIASKNIFYMLTKQSSVKMATTFNKALANKFGMTLEEALAYTANKNGIKQYKNPRMVAMMKDATQEAYHYQPGLLTSPLMKSLNVVWFPLRFQTKTVTLASKWLGSLTPMTRMTMINQWAHFATWAGTDEGIKWRRANANYLYNIFTYTTAYEQIGQSVEAVTKGRLFGGNAGMIGGVPFGVVVNIARELAIIPSDPDQYDPKTGKQFQKTTPKNLVSAATLSTSIEQLLISMSPSTPFYSLTGGAISGVSPSKMISSLVRQVVGGVREGVAGRDETKGKQKLERDFKRVPLEYTRLAE